MARLFIDGQEAEDIWVFVDGDQPIPDVENIIVSLRYLKENHIALTKGHDGQLGVHLEAGEMLADIANDLPYLQLVSLDFPSFADGRSFSKARLLRDRYQFTGEIRATGDIRIDQILFMKRNGFNALQITHQATITALQEGKDPALKLFYQPALGDEKAKGAKRWARRAG